MIKPLVSFVVYGECASKSNNRRIVTNAGRVRSIKSKKAMAFCEAFNLQAPKAYKPIECDLFMVCKIYYPTRRNDLDESLVMDCLQNYGIIKNDRQIKSKHIEHGIDKESPRVEVLLYDRNSGIGVRCMAGVGLK